VKAITPPENRARAVFCQWLVAKYVVNIQFLSNFLFTDEAGFTRDGVVNFHNTHFWVDNNPHTTVASTHHHRFLTNVWVGKLRDQLLLPDVLPNILTGAEHHLFF
jgi:hypothetical protein